MKKIGLFLSFIFMFFVFTLLVSCGSGNKTYKIMFTDYDGSVLYSEDVKKGQLPSYPLSEPTRKPDDDYTYTFSEWWPSIEKATEDKIYTAYYTRALKEDYTITFKNYDGTVLSTQTVKEGDKPLYLGDTPTKPHDENNKYLFGGWTPSLTEATGDTEYTANFIAGDLEKYMVIFAYEDNTVIKAYEVSEGDKPEYDGETPTMPNNEESKFQFRGWTPSITEVTEDTIYTAKFVAMPLDYTVLMDANGGKSASGKKLDSFMTDEIKASSFVYDIVKDNYRFDGWSYNDTLIFDDKGNALVNLDEIEFSSTSKFVAHYAEEAYVDVKYVAYSGVDNSIIDSYSILPAAYGSASQASFHKWNTIVEMNINLSNNYQYRFDGWYSNNKLLSTDVNYDYYLFNNDISLEARFTCRKYNLKIYVSDEEFGQLYVQDYSDWTSEYEAEFYYGQVVTVAAKTIDDIEFLGWYNLRNELVTDDYFYTFKVGDISGKLAAKWNYFKITYQQNNIFPYTNNPENPTYYTSTTPTITLKDPLSTPFGLKFKCWSTNGYDHSIPTIDTSKLVSVVYYPVWEKADGFDFDLLMPNTVITAIIPGDKNITKIDNIGFSRCSNLTTVLIPKSINNIIADAFKDCDNLNNLYYDGTMEDWLNITFGNGYSNPMYYAHNIYFLDEDGDIEFNGKKYSRLTDPIVTDETTTIKKSALSNCAFTSVTIPASVTTIEVNAFLKCTELKNVYYDGTLENWCNITFANVSSNPMNYGANLYLLDNDGTIIHNGKNYSLLTAITLPDNITDIKDYAFAGCLSITSFTGNTVLNTIGDLSFYGCSNLESVTFKKTLLTYSQKGIGKEAFAECTSLNTIKFTNSVATSVWSGIKKGTDWNRNVPATKVQFWSGTTVHYVDI